VELVERPRSGSIAVVVLPRLGDHHQDGVRQGATAEVQQFEHLVEGRRVRLARRADREQPGQVAGDQVGGSSDSRARIQLRLPLTVLISPLWAIRR
jgi:hypothetical protein